MTAKQKIEGLTNAWYGFILVSGLVSLVSSGFGIIALFVTAMSTAFGLFVTWFLGRRLLARSSLTRLVLVVLSGLSSLLGTIAVAKTGWVFLHEWSISLLVSAILTGCGVMMNVRSFRTLTDSSVKAYFG